MLALGLVSEVDRVGNVWDRKWVPVLLVYFSFGFHVDGLITGIPMGTTTQSVSRQANHARPSIPRLSTATPSVTRQFSPGLRLRISRIHGRFLCISSIPSCLHLSNYLITSVTSRPRPRLFKSPPTHSIPVLNREDFEIVLTECTEWKA